MLEILAYLKMTYKSSFRERKICFHKFEYFLYLPCHLIGQLDIWLCRHRDTCVTSANNVSDIDALVADTKDVQHKYLRDIVFSKKSSETHQLCRLHILFFWLPVFHGKDVFVSSAKKSLQQRWSKVFIFYSYFRWHKVPAL